MKIWISIGERQIEVDSTSLGYLANGAMEQYGEMFDGHGRLRDPELDTYARDLSAIAGLAREGWNMGIVEREKTAK